MLNKDKIHYNRNESLTILAMLYFWLSGRGPGKSTEAKDLVLSDYKKNEWKAMWILRNESMFNESKFYDSFLENFQEFGYTADSTGVYEPMYEKIINKATGEETVQPKINNSSGRILPNKMKPIILFVGASTMQSKLRSLDTKGIKWMIFDEFIPNLKMPNQRYLKGEAEAFMSCYNTIARNNNFETKCIFIGNPYQLSNPYFKFFGVNPKMVRENKDKVYVPFKDKAVTYNGKRYELIVIHYFSVNPELKAKIMSTPYAGLLSLNKEFYNTEMEGEEYMHKEVKVKKLNPYARLFAKIVVNGRNLYCYYDPENTKVTGVGYHFDTVDNGSKSIEYIALDLDDLGGDNVIVDRNNPLWVKLDYIKRSIRVNAYSVSSESINDDIVDILTY